jgi:hypothetical protein
MVSNSLPIKNLIILRNYATPKKIRTYAKKPGFYEKFIILTNKVYEETGFLGRPKNNSCVGFVESA